MFFKFTCRLNTWKPSEDGVYCEKDWIGYLSVKIFYGLDEF